MEFYFDNRFLTYGKYSLPLIQKQKIDLSNLKLIRFSDTVKEETEDLDSTVHFFIDDDRFDEIWRNPNDYVNELAQYKQLMSPGFSLYVNMSGALQIFNTFRNRWLGAFYQEKGMAVIPTIVWSNKLSFEYCFDAIEEGSIVAVSTIGCYDIEWEFMKGFTKMCEVIKPDKVICYAKPFDKMREFADIIEVPYTKTSRTSVAIEETK
jgi:hypothetical protein